MDSLEKKFRKVVDEHLPHLEEQRFLLAVSGGMDSVLLAHLFVGLKLNFTIAHCNFLLRGEESDRDEEFVRHLSDKLEVNFISRSFTTVSYAEEKKISIQMAARELRYSWFQELLKQHRFTHLVTAHHRNDQVETFFINLMRGSGIDGLSGMKILEGTIFRPLLPFSRQEMEHYVREKGIDWREDSSNASVVYTRNKLRHDVLPLLEEMAPAFISTAGETIDRLADVNAYYRMHMEAERARLLRKNEFGWEFDMSEVQAASVPRLLLFELMRGFGFRYPVLQQLLDNHVQGSGKKFFSHSHRAVLSRGVVVITRLAPEDLESYEIPEFTYRIDFPLPLKLQLRKNDQVLDPSPNKALFDRSALHFPLALRRWHKGDSFIPLGMKGKKKLSDFFIDQKLSLVEKEQIWVLCSADQTVWVVGHRIDDRYKIKEGTVDVLEISVDL